MEVVVEFTDVLHERHSIRSYSGRPVPRDVLDRIFEGAALAPSAMNEQPWRFYVATGDTRARVLEVMAQGTQHLEEYLEMLGREVTDEHLRWYTEFGGAPVIIAATMPRAADEFARLNKHISVGAAIQNLLLAATNEGVGACNVTFSFWVRDELASVFGVPEDRVIIALIAMGYASGEPPLAPPRDVDIAVYCD